MDKKTHSIYPIEIPKIEFLKELDLILLDLPARSLAQLPVGFGYVHDALKKTGIKFQTVDMDIIIYHRFHSRRIMDGLSEVSTSSGYLLPEDPWLPTHYQIWENPEVIEYFRTDIKEIVDGIINARPKILALSLQQVNLAFAREVVRGVRSGLPEVIVIGGGMSCLQPYAAKMVFPEADYIVVGEADLVVDPLVEALIKGERPRDLPGVWSRYDTPERVFTPGPIPMNLDAIGHPRYEWTDVKLYRNWNGYQLTPIVGSRGCSWSRCRFCGECFFWRARPPECVADDLEWFYQQGLTEFVFNESDLNGEPRIVEGLCDEIIRRKMKIRMTAQLRCHHRADKSYYNKLHAAGFNCLRFGIDGGSTNTLRLQRKGYSKEVARRNLKDSAKAGIYNEINLVVGVPGETEADIDETIEFIKELKSYIGRVAFINPLMLFRGSDYWDYPEKFGIYFHNSREDLYNRYPVAIPDHEWYSTNPYIDARVRFARFTKVTKALRDYGVPMGDFAEFTIEQVELKNKVLLNRHNAKPVSSYPLKE